MEYEPTAPKLKELMHEFESMGEEEYITLFNSTLGYNVQDIPKSNFKRLVEVESCKECPFLRNVGEYMVTAQYKCRKSNIETSEYDSYQDTKEILMELYYMFLDCQTLPKAIL